MTYAYIHSHAIEDFIKYNILNRAVNIQSPNTHKLDTGLVTHMNKDLKMHPIAKDTKNSAK